MYAIQDILEKVFYIRYSIQCIQYNVLFRRYAKQDILYKVFHTRYSMQGICTRYLYKVSVQGILSKACYSS